MFKTGWTLKVCNWTHNNSPIIPYLHKCNTKLRHTFGLLLPIPNVTISNFIQIPVILPQKYFLYQFPSLYPNHLNSSSKLPLLFFLTVCNLPNCKSLPITCMAPSTSPWSMIGEYFHLQPVGTSLRNSNLITLSLLHKSNQRLPNISRMVIKSSAWPTRLTVSYLLLRSLATPPSPLLSEFLILMHNMFPPNTEIHVVLSARSALLLFFIWSLLKFYFLTLTP